MVNAGVFGCKAVIGLVVGVCTLTATYKRSPTAVDKPTAILLNEKIVVDNFA